MITKTETKEELRKFLDAFTNDPCSNVQLKEDQKETFQAFVKELHDGEMPNNWRYQIIFDLLHTFVHEYTDDSRDQSMILDDLYDNLNEIADSLVDVYNSDRAKWLADDINRGCIDLKNLNIDQPNMTIFDLIGQAQYEAIYSMGGRILNLEWIFEY